jgi:hypothetical protein
MDDTNLSDEQIKEVIRSEIKKCTKDLNSNCDKINEHLDSILANTDEIKNNLNITKEQLQDVPVSDDLFKDISKFDIIICKVEGKIIGLWILFKAKIKKLFIR